jgi:signal transduction histidine kinase
MILFTTVSHVLGSTWQRDLIFSHASGQASPWLWSLIHGFAVLAACIGIVLFWHVTEDVQEKSVLARRLADAEAGKRRFTSDMLVNLARRNQSLLYRQLEIINQLEESERDPDTLAELFTLDHLATRVRRNAESLLVLSGEQPPRTWSKPVPMRDVLRAAIAETEDLDRVAFVADEQLAVAGHTVTDLTHLIAELTENAVRFSPPDSTVSIRARPNRQQPGGMLLTVEDWGVGMPPAQLVAANALLAKPPEVDLSVSQRLGFHVVARLAVRHGIVVSLRSTPGSGITATIVLPAALFAADAEPPDRADGTEVSVGAGPSADPGPVDGNRHGGWPVTARTPSDIPPLSGGGVLTSIAPSAGGAPLSSSAPLAGGGSLSSIAPPSGGPAVTADTPLTISLPAVRLPATEPYGGPRPTADPTSAHAPFAPAEPAAERPDQYWTGWWAAEVGPDAGAAFPTPPGPTFGPISAGGSPDGRADDNPRDADPTPLVPTPRPRTTSPAATPTAVSPALPPQADRRAAGQPADPVVDPVSGLRRRVPQAHLAPELRQPVTAAEPAASALPDRTAEAADALSRYQASRQAAIRTSTDNEYGWLS